MTHKRACRMCGSTLGVALVAMSWPSKIKCRSCTAIHQIPFAPVVGTVYFVVVFAMMFSISIGSHIFARVEDGIHTATALQRFVGVAAPAIAFLIVGPVYVWMIEPYLRLRER